jgi:hypothetical protein
MNKPFKIKIVLYNGKLQFPKPSKKQKEIADSFYCYEIIADIMKEIFKINSKYKFIETTHSISSHDEKKQLRFVYHIDNETKIHTIHFIQYCESSYFKIEELKYISEIIHVNLQKDMECLLEKPIIYLDKQYERNAHILHPFVNRPIENLLDERFKKINVSV